MEVIMKNNGDRSCHNGCNTKKGASEEKSVKNKESKHSSEVGKWLNEKTTPQNKEAEHKGKK